MIRLLLAFFATLASALVIAGCGGAPAPVPASPTQAAPATLMPAPTQPPAPTATQVPSSPGAVTTSFADALKNAKQAKVYRMELDLRGSGDLSGLGAAAESGEELTLLTMKGAVNDKDSDLTLGGALRASLITAFLGIDSEEGVEFLTVDNQGYIKGKLSGADEAQWYILPGDQTDVQSPLDAASLLEAFEEANLDPTAFEKISTETFDGVMCDVYSGDKDAVLQAFTKVGGPQETQLDPDTVEEAELRFYICADGFLHQMSMRIVAHDEAKPEEKGTFSVLMHIYDINGDIDIQAPEGALPLEIPGLDLATPTPES